MDIRKRLSVAAGLHPLSAAARHHRNPSAEGGASMAVVIPFAPHRRSTSERSERASASASADILFFTGVRYDRQDDGEPAKPAARPAAKRRAAPRPRRAKSAGQPV
jgi:hypothetical protein